MGHSPGLTPRHRTGEETLAEQIAWGPELETGIPAIDADHKELVNILNEVLAMRRDATASNQDLNDVLFKLSNYVCYHFQKEEKLFENSDYPATEEHKEKHRDLEKTVVDIHDLLGKDPDMLNLDEMENFLKRWLTNHIQKVDMSYVPHVAA